MEFQERSYAVIFFFLLIAILYFASYQPVLHSGFVWDDNAHVTENHLLETPRGFYRIWMEPGATEQYYPMTYSAFWLEYHLWGLQAPKYHAAGLLLHAANAFLFFMFLRRLGFRAAALAACFFLLHPVQTETAAWITEMKNLLSTFFFLLTAHAFWSACNDKDHPLNGPLKSFRNPYYDVALVTFAAALFSKTAACTWPIAMGIVLWASRRLEKKFIWALVPFVIFSFVSGFATIWMELHFFGSTGAGFDFSLAQRTLNAMRSLWFYPVKLLWPYPLMFVYPQWPGTLTVIDGLKGVALAGITGLAARAAWRGRRGPLAAWLYFIVCLAPALGFFNMFTMNYSWVADHFQYQASLGLLALAAGALQALAQRLRLAARIQWLAAAGLLLVLALRTHAETYKYRDVKSLWLDTLSKPACEMAHDNLAHYYFVVEHDPARAEFEVKTVLALNPRNVHARMNYALLLAQAGRIPEARQQYEESIRQDPTNAFGMYRYGLLLLKLNLRKEAAEQFRRALSLQPDLPAVQDALRRAEGI